MLPAIGNLGKILGFNPDFGRGILKAGGFFQNEIYLTTTPLKNATENLMPEATFVSYFLELYKKANPFAPKQLYLINATTGEKMGPYPSVTYVCKHVLVGAS